MASPGAGEGDGDAASSVDAAILSSVRALGRYPIWHLNPKREEELEERKLYRAIKYHGKQLSKETLSELEELRAPREYGFTPELLRKKAALRKHKAPEDLRGRLALMLAPQPVEVFRKQCAGQW